MPEILYRWRKARSFSRGRNGKIETIILHSTDGHREGDIETLSGSPKVSAHFYVSRPCTDGECQVWHFVDNCDTAWHAGKVDPDHHEWTNGHTIGIEMEHMDGEQDWPVQQLSMVARLICALRQRYGPIPVKGHAEIAWPKGRKQDPKDFPWQQLSSLVAGFKGADWRLVQARSQREV